MSLVALQTLLTIVRTGSLVRASEELNVTQSTVTARLKALEEDLGQTLLVRRKSGATLTASGLKLVRYAEVMTELWRQARQETALPEGTDALCNVGCHIDLWPGVGRQFLDSIREKHPSIALSAWPGSHAEMEQWLDAGVVEVALTFQPATRENQTLYRLPEENLVLVSTNPASPMRFDPHYIYVEGGADFGRRHAEAYADAGTADISFGSAVWALQHMLDHCGSAYLPERMVAQHIEDGTLHRIANAPDFTRPVCLITNDIATAAWDWLPPLIESLLGNTKPQ